MRCPPLLLPQIAEEQPNTSTAATLLCHDFVKNGK